MVTALLPLVLAASGPLAECSREVTAARLFPDGDPAAPPVLRLNLPDTLVLTFDLSGNSHRNLRAELLHFDADRSPSALTPAEFTDGWNDIPIDDYQYSAPVFHPYVNYRLTIPSPGLTPAVSGNFAVRVFPEEQPDSTLLLMPFDVSENLVETTVTVSADTGLGFNDGWQEVKAVVTGRLPDGTDPFSHMNLEVVQNENPWDSRTLTRPLRADATTVVFGRDPALVFRAGNEFRRFDTLQTDRPGLNVSSVSFDGSGWNALLDSDSPRGDSPYLYDSTPHGAFIIDEFNSSEPDLGADYVTVRFTLLADRIPEAEIYVDGDFSLRRLTPQNRMHWNQDRGCYEASILLKQGSYSYRYLVLAPGGMPDPAPIEGDFHETRNRYRAKVFVRTPADRHDRLVSASQ